MRTEMVRKTFIGALLSIGVISCVSTTPTPQVVDLVDPQIGSVHGRWFFYTPAALPFGMAKLAPTTNAYNSYGSWMPNGYDDRHTSIEGFAHLHEFQIGGVVTIPTTGELKTLPGSLTAPDSGYRSRFDKGTEIARPGYYAVTLADYDVRAELTATERVGFHRYTFNQATDTARILFDIGHPQGESATVVGTQISYDKAKNQLSGWVECYPVYATFCDQGNTVKAYFVAQMDKVPAEVGTFRDSLIYRDTDTISGVGTGFFAEFPVTAGEVVQMQVGLSYTGLEGALANLKGEATEGLTFDQVHSQATQKWNDMLSRIQVTGGKAEDRTKFYTGLYHALLGRGLASDIDGRYVNHDKSISQTPIDANGKATRHHYNTDGIWGGFWNLTQLWTIAYPDYFNQYVLSNIDFSKNTGWLHDGEAAGVYTNGVQTNFMGLIICAAQNAGILTEDLQGAYKAVRKNELGYIDRPDGAGRYDNEYFVKNGYVPSKAFVMPNGWASNFGASHTLEYSFAASAAAGFARRMGFEADADTLARLANGWKMLFDTSTMCIRPLNEDGTFIKDFDPMRAWDGFQEGNAVQYTWYVPHDVEGLISIMGTETFNKRLEETFAQARKTKFGGGDQIDSFSGVEMLYNQGNQPCLHNSWLFNYSGKPWLTQLYTRLICNEFYGTTPTHGYGFGQDEDQGQLGAWYVMAAMGLFDVAGGTGDNPTMQLGSPLFDRIAIQLDPRYYTGKEFVIEVENNGAENYYIQSASLNGSPMESLRVPLKDIQNGGKLNLKMSAEPNIQYTK